MRRLLLCSLLVALAGCTIPMGPSYQSYNSEIINYFGGLLPTARYDGIFASSANTLDEYDTAGTEFQSLSYFSYVQLYNIFGNGLIGSTSKFSAKIDNIALSQGLYDTLNLHFPDSVLWEFSGDYYYPPCTYTIASENFPKILTPLIADSLDVHSSFELTYNSPGSDSVSVNFLYEGYGVYASDTTDSRREVYYNTPSSIATNGQYMVPAFQLDTSNFKSFNPKKLFLSIAWGRGDTVHEFGKLYGFTTTAEYERVLYFKQ